MTTIQSTAKTVVTEAAAVGATVAVVLGSLAALLPQLHVPASDTAIVTAVTTALTAFLSWARSKGLAPKS